MGFLIQIGLGAVGLWLVLVLSILGVAAGIFIWRILRSPVSNKIAYVAAAALIAMAAMPILFAVVQQ